MMAETPSVARDPALLKSLAPRAGFEPATNRLTAGCSTAELPGNTSRRIRTPARRGYIKGVEALQRNRPKGPGHTLAGSRGGSPCRRKPLQQLAFRGNGGHGRN